MSAMTKTLLIVSGGEEAVDIARGLQAMGHAVVISDADPQAPAFAFADSCLIADVHGASETAAAAERYNRKIRKIDGVLCDRRRAADRRHGDGAVAPAGAAAACRRAGRRPAVDPALFCLRRHCRALACGNLHPPGFAARRHRPRPRACGQAGGKSRPRRCLAAGGDKRLSRRFPARPVSSRSERVMVEQDLEGPCATVAGLMHDGRCHVAAGTEPVRPKPAAAPPCRWGFAMDPVTCEIVLHQNVPHVTDISLRLDSPHFLTAAAKQALGEKPTPEDLRG